MTNNHEGHRTRMRERYLKNGFDGFAPHEVLEMLLYQLIPLKDTNALAHTLLDSFGSLPAVLQAKPEELAKIPGLNDTSAVYLSMYYPLFRYYAKVKNEGRSMLTVNSIYKYGALLFDNTAFEEMYVLCLDSRGRLVGQRKFTDHSTQKVTVSPRDIAETAFSCNSASVVLVHAHPRGLCQPSRSDDEFTKLCYTVLKGMGILLLEHMIFADGEYYSYYSSDKLHMWYEEYNKQFNILGVYQKELKIKK